MFLLPSLHLLDPPINLPLLPAHSSLDPGRELVEELPLPLQLPTNMHKNLTFPSPRISPLRNPKHHPTTNTQGNLHLPQSPGKEIPMQLPRLRIGPRQLDVDVPQPRRPDRLPRRGQGVDRANQGADPLPRGLPRGLRHQGGAGRRAPRGCLHGGMQGCE